MSALRQKVDARQAGLSLYGLAPPKLGTPPEELRAIAARQIERLRGLALDGLVVYDIQDEAARTAEPRPFPFLPTLDPGDYAESELGALAVPKIVYRSVQRDTPESFVAWLRAPTRAESVVLVGAPSRRAQGAFTLRAAYDLVRQHAPELLLGAIAIAERHGRTHDEHERMLAKIASGSRFFVTQAVYDVTSSLSLLSDYALSTARDERLRVPLVLTFSPCGSLKTLHFMKWLGIAFPRWLENELAHARDPLETSLRACERIFAELWDYAREKGIPLGVNVESVSIRKAEVEASIELSKRLSRRMDAAGSGRSAP